MRFEELAPEDKKMARSNMNAVIQTVEKLANLRVGAGLSLSDGPAGLMLALSGEVQIAIAKLGVHTGSYPSWESDRYVFPARILGGPKFDPSDVDAAHTQAYLEQPAVDVYNLEKCWMFENDLILIYGIGGLWWTKDRRYRTGTAAAAITKGNLGNVTIGSFTMQARALYGDTVNGKAIGIEFDGLEWVISEEECP